MWLIELIVIDYVILGSSNESLPGVESYKGPINSQGLDNENNYYKYLYQKLFMGFFFFLFFFKGWKHFPPGIICCWVNVDQILANAYIAMIIGPLLA